MGRSQTIIISIVVILVAIAVFLFTSQANAQGYQQQAQAEVNYMATHRIRSHVWGTIAHFEGVGWSTSGVPNTCTPRYRMVLVADAVARDRWGHWYRVRAWRR